MNIIDCEISDDRSRIDIARVHEMLSRTSWSPGISAEELQKGIENSVLVVGIYHPEFGQIGFMRVLSDTIRFAYIMDVVIYERFRRQGLGKKMVSYACNHPSLSKVYRWLLATSDAHGVYQKLGFRPLAKPDTWMMIDKGIPVFPREM